MNLDKAWVDFAVKREDTGIEKMKISHAVFNKGTKKMMPHSLTGHLQGVAHLSEQFASVFANGDWGRVAGLLHDLGKGSKEFQKYIRDVPSNAVKIQKY